jgi:hypothetical protein
VRSEIPSGSGVERTIAVFVVIVVNEEETFSLDGER